MKRVLLIFAVALLIPGMLSAATTMGVYFGYMPGEMNYHPTEFVFFDAYLYLHHADVYITAVEYQLVTPNDLGHALFTITALDYPDNMSINLGNPFSGHSIAYWPPLNGYVPGYNLMCKYTCITTDNCLDEGGVLVNYQLVIGPHPDSGELRGTYFPDNLFFDITGSTSLLCPDPNEIEEESWGAIKSMYR